jgi:hypothetical protein
MIGCHGMNFNNIIERMHLNKSSYLILDSKENIIKNSAGFLMFMWLIRKI